MRRGSPVQSAAEAAVDLSIVDPAASATAANSATEIPQLFEDLRSRGRQALSMFLLIVVSSLLVGSPASPRSSVVPRPNLVGGSPSPERPLTPRNLGRPRDT